MAEAALHLEQGSGRLAGVCPQGGKAARWHHWDGQVGCMYAEKKWRI